MASFTIRPAGWAARKYEVSQDDTLVTTIKMSAWRERLEFTIADQRFEFVRDGWKGPHVLRHQGMPVARLKRPSFWRTEYWLEYQGRNYLLKSPSFWKSHFELYVGSMSVGSVRRVKWNSRDVAVQLPDELSMAVQVIVAMMVVMIWRRQSAAAAGAAGGA